MPPDVDAYAAAVAGRALATKCTGGFTTRPRRPTGGPYYLDYVTRPPLGSGFNLTDLEGTGWDGKGFGYSRSFTQTGIVLSIKQLFGIEHSLFRPFGQVAVRGLIIPAMSSFGPFGDGQAIPDDFLVQGKTVIFEGYYEDPETKEWSDPFWPMTFPLGITPVAFGSPTKGWHLTVGFGGNTSLSRPSGPSDDRTVTGMSIRDAAAVTPSTQDTFEFYARLEGGVGSVLEADGEGSQTELQTIDMTVRYDARFRVGEWVRIGNDLSFVYEIQSIDEVGRRKWQTLTMIKRVAT